MAGEAAALRRAIRKFEIAHVAPRRVYMTPPFYTALLVDLAMERESAPRCEIVVDPAPDVARVMDTVEWRVDYWPDPFLRTDRYRVWGRLEDGEIASSFTLDPGDHPHARLSDVAPKCFSAWKMP